MSSLMFDLIDVVVVVIAVLSCVRLVALVVFEFLVLGHVLPPCWCH